MTQTGAPTGPVTDDCLVVPLSFFTRASIDMTSGGQFLRRLEWFLNQYDAGKVVMASTGRGEGPTEEDSAPKCPLGAWIASPPTVSAYSQRIISGKNAARIDRDSQQSGGEGEV